MTSLFLHNLQNDINPPANADAILDTWYEDCTRDTFNLAFYVSAFQTIFAKTQDGILPDEYYGKLLGALECRLTERFAPLLADMYCLKQRGFYGQYLRVVSMNFRLRYEREGPPVPWMRYTDDDILDAISLGEGDIRAIAEVLGTHKQTIYYRLRKSAELRAALEAARNPE